MRPHLLTLAVLFAIQVSILTAADDSVDVQVSTTTTSLSESATDQSATTLPSTSASVATETTTSSPTSTPVPPPTTTTSSPPPTTATVASTTLAELISSAPTPANQANDVNTTNSMAPTAPSFSCYGRQIGYYAEPQQDCRKYHFCLQGEYNGEIVYQRITYLCLNETTFDQQALDCVEPSRMSAPCEQSVSFYDTSNVILRRAVVDTSVSHTQ